MAFNIIAETSKGLEYEKIHRELYRNDLSFDLFPMPGAGLNGGDALGICVPLKNANEQTWNQLKTIIKKLRSEFNCDVYDLYGGQKLGLFNSDMFRKNLLGT